MPAAGITADRESVASAIPFNFGTQKRVLTRMALPLVTQGFTSRRGDDASERWRPDVACSEDDSDPVSFGAGGSAHTDECSRMDGF